MGKLTGKKKEDHLKDILEKQMMKGNIKLKDVKDKTKLK